MSTGRPTSAFVKGLKLALVEHLSPRRSVASSDQFPLYKFLYLIVVLTIGISAPALLWFAAITLASVTDVTAIWNTNAFFAYLFSVKVFGLKWETRKLGAVVLATAGVLAVVYGGSTSGSSSDEPASTSTAEHIFPKPSAPLVGDLLTLVASVGYAGYQVFYKKYAALATDPESLHDDHYEPVPRPDDNDLDAVEASNLIEQDAVYPLPYGLYSNMLTSAIGLCTLLFLWIPLPFLHWFDVERFTLPQNSITVAVILGIALSGSIFNAGFMILLGAWGPIITSVGGLLTIVLVFISDVALGDIEALTAWSILGSATIIAAFGVLAYDILNRR